MERSLRLLLATHAGAALFMTGVIWFVQLVHYPLMSFVDPSTSAAFARANIARTAAVVGPVMLLEALTGLALLWRRPRNAGLSPLPLSLALLAAAWVSTALSQFPAHRALAEGGGPRIIAGLIASNWLRTACWSARAVLVLRMLLETP